MIANALLNAAALLSGLTLTSDAAGAADNDDFHVLSPFQPRSSRTSEEKVSQTAAIGLVALLKRS